ncbi:MAG: lysophospholipid acyltransferase family protein [Candidatus Aminicenantaceae bacterium]
MSVFKEVKLRFIGFLGKLILGLWTKSARLTVIGEDRYQELRNQNKPVVLLIWHGRLLVVPYLFKKRGILALISPSEDGEILARIVSGWGKVLRGSSSHSIVKAWSVMRKELDKGGEVIIVPDGPKGPNRKMKLGALKLSQQSGAYLVPFTFAALRKKTLNSWDSFLIFYPFTRVAALFGDPIVVDPKLRGDDLEIERQRIEQILLQLDDEAANYLNL